jgi:hypothetical protein
VPALLALLALLAAAIIWVLSQSSSRLVRAQAVEGHVPALLALPALLAAAIIWVLSQSSSRLVRAQAVEGHVLARVSTSSGFMLEAGRRGARMGDGRQAN